MEIIYKNDELLKLTKGPVNILDSSVTRFDIYYQENQLHIDVYFNLIYKRFKTEKQLKIHFSDITRYQFVYSNDHQFYNVELCKFFKSENGYYISLDPVDESEKISEDDEDVILCKNMEGYFI